MNKAVLDEIQRIVDGNGDTAITQKAINRVLLAGLAQTLTMIDNFDQKFERMMSDMKRSEDDWHIVRERQVTDQTHVIDTMSNTISFCKCELDAIKKRVDGFESNPVFQAGKFISAHPRESLFIFAILVLAITSWDIIGLVAGLFGLPNGVITTPVP